MDRNRYRTRANYGLPTRQSVPDRNQFATPQPVAQPSPVSVGGAASAKTVHAFELSLKLRLPQATLPSYRPGRRVGIAAAVLVIALMVSTAGYGVHQFRAATASVNKVAASKITSTGSLSVVARPAPSLVNPPAVTSTTSSSSAKTLNFTPVVPNGEPQLAKLGSSAFNKAVDSYTFNDLYLAEPLQVSEQPISTSYASPALAIEAVGNALHATTSFTTTSGTAYLATNSDGTQTVVFATKGLLVFAKSNYQHSTDLWAGYLDSLQ